MKNKIIFNLTMFLFVFAAGMIGYIAFYSLYPFRTVEYLNSPFPILNPDQVVVAGSDVSYVVDYCRYTDLPTHVTRSLVNEIIYTLPSVDVKSPEGCESSVTIVSIPKEIAPGKYHLESSLSWNINGFRVVTKQVRTQEFTVVSLDRE
jgi:hypothetical protein